MRVQGLSSGLSRPDPGAFSADRALALPFLPTLFTAVVIAGLSLLCRQPADAELPQPAAITSASLTPSMSAGAHPPAEPGSAAAIPATIAFGQLYPLTPEAPALAQAVRPNAPRVASSAKRGCAAGRCEAKKPDTTRSATLPQRPETPPPLPFVARDDEDALPTGALPFVPAAASVVDTVRSFGKEAAALGTDAAALGGSVIVDTVAFLR